MTATRSMRWMIVAPVFAFIALWGAVPAAQAATVFLNHDEVDAFRAGTQTSFTEDFGRADRFPNRLRSTARLTSAFETGPFTVSAIGPGSNTLAAVTAGFRGQDSNLLFANHFRDTLNIAIDPGHNAFSFDLATILGPQRILVTVFNNENRRVASQAFNARQAGARSFVGVISDMDIARVTLDVISNADSVGIDNLTVGVVTPIPTTPEPRDPPMLETPTPAALPLFFAGLGALGLLRRHVGRPGQKQGHGQQRPKQERRNRPAAGMTA